jgi:hypothetical protein
MKLAVIDTEGYNLTHHGFLDNAGGASRIINSYHCTSSGCTSGAQGPQGSKPYHGTNCAAYAAGSIRQNQIAGFTDQEELERTGAAEEVEIYPFSIDNNSSAREAIEFAADLGVDVLSSSYSAGVGVDPCDGIITGDIGYSVYDAQFLGMIVVQAAGNNGGSPCNMTGIGEAPSAFVVGGSNDGGASTWSTRNVWSGSQPGGAGIYVDGNWRAGALSLVSAIAPRCMNFGYDHTTDDGIVDGGCGTSYSTPQVAGAAIQIKDWFLGNGYSQVDIEGRLFTVLLAMTDRAKITDNF